MTAEISAVAGRASVSLVAKDIHQTLGGTVVLRGVDMEAAAEHGFDRRTIRVR